MSQTNTARRPIKARDTRWADSVATWLARVGVRPNVISVASALFAAGAGLCLVLTGRITVGLEPWLFLAAAGLIQMRLLCNLFDGMVAVEGGLSNEVGADFQWPSGSICRRIHFYSVILFGLTSFLALRECFGRQLRALFGTDCHHPVGANDLRLLRELCPGSFDSADS